MPTTRAAIAGDGRDGPPAEAPGGGRQVKDIGRGGRISRADRPGRRLGVGWATRIVYAGLWLAVSVGVVGGGWSLLEEFAGGGATAAPVVAPPPPVGPAGWAVLYVEAYLSAGSGTEQSLAPFLGQVPSLPSVKPATWAASSAVAVDARQADPGYWSVTVAAQVLGAPPATAVPAPGVPTAAPSVPLGTRYYTVGVQASGGGYVAATVPMEVAAPAPGKARATVFGPAGPPGAGDPVADTTSRFLAALLAGQGEIGRYLAPGSTVAPIVSAPFSQVTVTGLSRVGVATPAGAAPRIEVLAGAECTDAAGRVQELVYVLDLTRLLGRWNVSRLIGAPPLVGP